MTDTLPSSASDQPKHLRAGDFEDTSHLLHSTDLRFPKHLGASKDGLPQLPGVDLQGSGPLRQAFVENPLESYANAVPGVEAGTEEEQVISYLRPFNAEDDVAAIAERNRRRFEALGRNPKAEKAARIAANLQPLIGVLRSSESPEDTVEETPPHITPAAPEADPLAPDVPVADESQVAEPPAALEPSELAASFRNLYGVGRVARAPKPTGDLTFNEVNGLDRRPKPEEPIDDGKDRVGKLRTFFEEWDEAGAEGRPQLKRRSPNGQNTSVSS